MDENTSQQTKFSTRTKWCIVGGFAAVCALLYIILYQIIYEIGYNDGARYTPPEVIRQSEEQALAVASNFVKDVFESPQSLAELLKNRHARMSWIKDEAVKENTSWGLTRELMNRGSVIEAMPIAAELIGQGYQLGKFAEWAPRAELVAKNLCHHHHFKESIRFWADALQGYQSVNNQDGMLHCLRYLVYAEQNNNRLTHAIQYLEQAIILCDQLGEKARLSKAHLLAARGRIAYNQGKRDDSQAYFKKAIELVSPEGTKENSDFSLAYICLGEAMLELGKKREAKEYFLKGIPTASKDKFLVNDYLSALRGLARISVDFGKYEEALAYLHQAEGAAHSVLARNHVFWAGLYDQRGWLGLLRNTESEACLDFTKALETPSATPIIKAQSTEGLGRAYLLLGDGAKACGYLAESVRMREAHFPGDSFSLGRVYFSLGQAEDLSGRVPEALQAYTKSVNYLQSCKSSDAQAHLLKQALLCRAYAQCDALDWSGAVESFQQVLPMLEGDQKLENYKQLARCYDKLGMTGKADECWKEGGAPRASRSSSRKRNKGR